MVELDRRNALSDSTLTAAMSPIGMIQVRGLLRSQSLSNLSADERSNGSGNLDAQVLNGHGIIEQNSIATLSTGVTTPSTLPLGSAILGSSEDDSFLFQPVPLGQRIQCKIIRRKNSSIGSLYPQYELYLEGSNGSRFFLMSARRKKKTKGATYLISLNRFEDGEFDDRIVGKVKSNFLGTLFTIYDGKREERGGNICGDEGIIISRKEQAAVMYEPNVLGLRGPRKLTLLLPGLTSEGRICPIQYKPGRSRLSEKFQTDEIADILVMRNKTPQWSEETQSYVLNFHNRVSQASVKNFQIIPEFDLDYIVMQFGRVGVDTFTMDFQYPLSALQAFGITLTSFDPKLACE